MVPFTAANAYARIGLETGVAAATPQRLVVMLYDGALAALAEARRHILAGDTPQKGRAIGKAIAIVSEGLKGSLNMARGGTIALHLHDLYDYLERRLLAANLTGDVAGIDEAAALLGELRGAWATLAAGAGMEASHA
jgi:flagellar protein FliS